MAFVDLVKSFLTRIFTTILSQKSASIQPRTSCVFWQKMRFQQFQVKKSDSSYSLRELGRKCSIGRWGARAARRRRQGREEAAEKRKGRQGQGERSRYFRGKYLLKSLINFPIDFVYFLCHLVGGARELHLVYL